MSDTSEPASTAAPAPQRARVPRGVVVAAVFIAVMMVGAGVGVWWRVEDDFCDRVSSLPDATASVSSTGTPAQSLLDYAKQLDAVADAAPTGAVADAARQVAVAERAVGEALEADPTSPAAVSAIAAANSPQVVAAQATLNAEIAKRCG